ncbi:hypothetical protein [Paraburkholderia bannensis]|nr:hypothetical protein [Paraburkholderia bannensis]
MKKIIIAALIALVVISVAPAVIVAAFLGIGAWEVHHFVKDGS